MSQKDETVTFGQGKPSPYDPEEVERSVREKMARAITLDVKPAKTPFQMPFGAFIYEPPRQYK